MTIGRKILLLVLILLPVSLLALFDFLQWEGILSVNKTPGTVIYGLIFLLATIFAWLIVREVTFRKKTEAWLRETDDSARLLIDNIKDYALMRLDAIGKVVSWNSGAEHIKGYKAGEVIGKSFEIFYTPEDVQQGIPAENLRITKLKGHYETEGWRLRKDGSKFWANAVFTSLLDKNGNLQGFAKITRDITDRKQTEEKLYVLSRQIEQSGDAIYIVDTGRIIRSWNKGAEKLYGYTAKEAIGAEANILLQTNLSEKEIGEAVRSLKEKDYWSGELKRKNKAGKDIYVRSSNSTIKDESGLITAYVAVNIDMTEEVKLREQVNYLATLVDQSTDAIVSIDLNENIRSWNKGAEQLYGYTSSEVLGKNAISFGIIRLTPGETKKIFSEILAKGYWQSEMNLYHKNGAGFFGAINASFVKDEKGKITSIVFDVKDISIRKQLEDELKKHNTELEERIQERTLDIYKSEKRFRALIEHNYDIIALLDESLNIVYRSPSAARITGWSDEEMQHNPNSRDIHPDDAETVAAHIRTLIANPGKSVNTQFRTRHKEGHFIWLEGILINLLHDEDVKALVFNFRDVTERIAADTKIRQALQELSDYKVALDKSNAELEERVSQRTAQLKKVNEELEAFSYSVSHDLRAPLRAIIGFTAILEEEYSSKLDDEARRITGIIKGSTLKMGNLIDDLLAFSRMSRQDIEKILIDTNELVHQIITEQEKKNTSANIQWIIHPLHNTMGDISAIRQVWINLVSNAIKYSGSKPGQRIEIGSSSDDKQTTFFIKDNGVGFDQKYSDKLFKVFQRLHSSTEFEGTGVGLAIVEKIISKHGGKVWAEAEVQKGASFYFSLPIINTTL
jgi:PAS domain S-box-containing protein